MSKNYIQIDHPLIKHKLGYLRDKETCSAHFRQLMNEVASLLILEATKDLPMISREVETPLQKTNVERCVEPPIIVPIMRAGMGMFEGIMQMIPFAPTGHIGIYRDKFIKNTVEYYFKMPEDCKDKEVILVDPLLATGDTAVSSIDRLKQYEVGKIKMVCLLVSEEGLAKIHEFHPEVEVYSCGMEMTLNDNGYLLPGIGDAGDRLFKTK